MTTDEGTGRPAIPSEEAPAAVVRDAVAPAAVVPAAVVPAAVVPAAIVPDTKDWTWVLDRPCPECGFVAADVAPDAIGRSVRESLPRWDRVLARADAGVRPDPTTWSPAEYAAHVRDVFGVFDVRLASMLEGDDPQFANWDQDATAIEEDYAHQDPAVVARELAVAGERIAARFDAVTPDQWERPGRRSNGSAFTVRTLGQYFLHDVVHHLHDVRAEG